MSDKADWQAAHDQMVEEERRRLGEPPTAEEVLAYTRGELAPDDEARVRALLVCYPELARTLTQPFSNGDSAPLSDAEVSRHWAAFRKRVDLAPPGRVLHFWRASAALAAALALLFGALLWREQQRSAEPRAWEGHLLLPDGQRGGEPPAAALPADEDVVVFLPLIDPRQFADYRLEIVDLSAGAPRRVWSRTGVRRGENDTFVVHLPRAFAAPGRYQFVIYGIEGAREERLSSYSVRVR